MKLSILEKELEVNEDDKIFMKLFEEDLSKRLDEIFKMESKKLILELNENLKEPICKTFNNN